MNDPQTVATAPDRAAPPVPRLTGSTLAGICGLYFLSRLLFVATATVSRTVITQGLYNDPARSWIERLRKWDSNWYLDIAQRGYHFNPHGESSVGFYPLYPLLIRLLAKLGLDPLLAGYAISHIALFAACIYLWRLAAWETRSSTVGTLAVTFLLLGPGAVWFGLIYTESLFLLTVLACLYAARRGRWLQAALWGYAAAVTRTPGLFLTGFLLLEAFQQWWETRPAKAPREAVPVDAAPVPVDALSTGKPVPVAAPGRARWLLSPFARRAWAVGSPILGQLTFLIFLQLAFGDWRAQQKTMTAGWFPGGPRPPWTALITEWTANEPIYPLLADPLLIVVVLAGVASLWTLRRLAYPAFVLSLVLLYLVSTDGQALVRYFSTLAPMYLVLAQLARRSRMLETAIIAGSVAVTVLLTILLANGYRVN